MRGKGIGKAGFTLVEVIVVLVILALLAAIMIPAMTGWIDKAKQKQAYVELHTIAMAAESAYVETYATNPQIAEVTFINLGSGVTPGVGDGSFTQSFSQYLNSPEILENIRSVYFLDASHFWISYRKNDINYSYASVEGQVTIVP